MRSLEQSLLTAEKLAVLAKASGAKVDDQMTWRAWEPVLFNQTHDLASGVMTDRVRQQFGGLPHDAREGAAGVNHRVPLPPDEWRQPAVPIAGSTSMASAASPVARAFPPGSTE